MSSRVAPLLTLENITKEFDGNPVLNGINLTINKGENFCLIGQSGHGKSVLLKTIMGLIPPTSGTIKYRHTPIIGDGISPKVFDEYRHKFGLLFQGAALFDSLTVGENIGFSLRERGGLSELEIQQKIIENLSMVELQKFENMMPSDLSGGMKSRVGLARAVALEPEIMLYDEPTSALDPIMSDHIGSLIEILRSKLFMTSIIITHDVSLAYRIADKIAMLYKGKIIFYGTPAEIKREKDPYIQQFLQGEKIMHSSLMK